MSNISYICQQVKDYISNNISVIVIVEAKERKYITDELRVLNVKVDELKDNSQIKFLDARFFLSNFILDDENVDIEFLNTSLIHSVENSRLNYSNVAVIDGMVEILVKRGDLKSAQLLENQLHSMAQVHGFPLFVCDSSQTVGTIIENSVQDVLGTSNNAFEYFPHPIQNSINSVSV